MSERKRKRSQDDYEALSHNSIGQTLARINGASPPAEKATDGNHEEPTDPDNGDDWEVAGSKRSKKRKKAPTKEKGNYPSIGHSAHARLQSYVKIHDLQNLVLYLLADGTSPQWCSIKHHSNVRKVVTLMVPGLEAGMFDGAIPLESKDAAHVDTEKVEKDEGETAKGKEANATLLGAQLFGTNPSAEGDTHEVVKAATEEVVVAPQPEQPVKRRKLNITPDDYYPTKLVEDQLPEPLTPFCEVFDHLWPVKTPGDDKHARLHSPLASILTAPIPKTKEEKNRKGPQPPAEGRNWKNKRTPVTELLATTAELMEEGYVMHPAHFTEDRDLGRAEAERRQNDGKTTEHGWVDTKNINKLSDGDAPADQVEQGSLTLGRKVLAMDCEMCITSPEGVTPQEYSLTRISIIDWDGNTVMDEFVQPDRPITNYLTQYSGITPEMLEGVTTSLKDIQEKLLTILTPQSILIGHSLNSDLNALHITHPFIIDTALLFPHPRGPPLKSSLKWLCSKYLSREIQKGSGSTGHNSVEDARACLDLVKQKCERGKLWGTSEASGESIFKRLSRSIRPKRDKVNPMGDDEPRTGAVVDWGEPLRGFGSQAKLAIGCETDADVVAGIKRALTGDETGESMPKDGVDFIWARMRELEARQGWWNRSKGVDSDALRTTTTASSTETPLAEVVSQTAKHIRDIYEALPPCTAFVVYSGSGDPRELAEMQALQTKFKQEYKVKKWDQLSVRWTDVEEQKLKRACEKARKGVGFIAVK